MSARAAAADRLAGLDVAAMFDLDGTGTIDAVVFARSLKAFDGDLFTDTNVGELMAAVTEDEGGRIRINDFAKAIGIKSRWGPGVRLDAAAVSEHRERLVAAAESIGGARKLFKVADNDESSPVDPAEFQALCTAVASSSPALSEEECSALFWHLDSNATGFLERGELVAWIETGILPRVLEPPGRPKTPALPTTLEELRQGIDELEKQILVLAAKAKDVGMEWMVSFGQFDDDVNKTLTLTEFTTGLEKLGIEPDLIEVGAGGLFSRRDWSRDGMLSLKEFQEFMAGKLENAVEAPAVSSIAVLANASADGSLVTKLAEEAAAVSSIAVLANASADGSLVTKLAEEAPLAEGEGTLATVS